MKRFKHLFFDLDGTLVDSSIGIKETFNHTFSQLGEERPSEHILDSFIGPPLEVSFASVLEKDQVDQAILLYRGYYREKGIYGAELYKGVKELLDQLKKAGFKLYVTTSKHEPVAVDMLVNLGIIDRFDAVFGSLPDSFHKADVLKRAIKSRQAALQESIIIGDTKFDMTGGKEVGISRMGVMWGFGSKEELQNHGADFLAATPQEVFDTLSKDC